MLRITEKPENGKTVRLRLDGTVSALSLAEIEEICLRHQSGKEKKIVLLDMGGVVFMNDEAARKLAAWRSDRVKIINCSPFIEALLQTMNKKDGK